MKSFLVLTLFLCLVAGAPKKICPSDCKIENDCRCASTYNPINNPNDPAPQLIALTVSESVVTTLYHDYLVPLFFDRLNPDGKPIGATFYVNHEYTDYELVQKLYLHGYEIGVHSVTKNSSQEYWRHATLEDLIQEFSGQKQIISTFAKIPEEDIVGVRTPQLQLEGDLSIDAYVASGLTYDNSWPTSSSQLLFPYTLDYKSPQQCYVTISCPSQPHEHFWIAPITNIRGKNNVECNSLATCLVEGSAQEIARWLIKEINRVYNDNRAPLVLRLDSYWFKFTKNSMEGFELFLDEMAKHNDVFFVSVQDVLKWVKNPVPASMFQSSVYHRTGECMGLNCRLSLDGSERYMKSCIPCPELYPWKGNPLGKA